jgi:hypothetical protein
LKLDENYYENIAVFRQLNHLTDSHFLSQSGTRFAIMNRLFFIEGKMRIIFYVLLCCSVLHSAAFADEVLPLWSDLADIFQFAPKAMPDAAVILNASKDARFTQSSKYRAEIRLTDPPATAADGTITYRAAAMMTESSGQVIYRKFLIKVGGQPHQVIDVKTNDVPLSRMHFVVNVGLVDHLVMIEDLTNDVRMAFPLGVGGLDQGIVDRGISLLTPIYHGAYLERARVTSLGGHYRNLPVMYLTSPRGSFDGIGFHITLISDQDWKTKGPNYLLRGFESHACMRMRYKDLMEFHTIVMLGGDTVIPVNTDYFLWKAGSNGIRDHKFGVVDQVLPYPFNDANYMHIQYYPESPHWRKDPDGNYTMRPASGQPDLSKLNGFDASDLTNLQTFLERKAEMKKFQVPEAAI